MFLWCKKDGGPESKVYAWGIEIKSLFSILILKFEKGSREASHTHAFNSLSWLLKGALLEVTRNGSWIGHFRYQPSLKPIRTPRSCYHEVKGIEEANWVLTFRGPWSKTWKEYLPKENREVTLTHGRREI